MGWGAWLWCGCSVSHLPGLVPKRNQSAFLPQCPEAACAISSHCEFFVIETHGPASFTLCLPPHTYGQKSKQNNVFDASADCATFPTPHNRLAAHHTAVRAPGPAGRQHYGWPLVNQVATGRKVTDRNWPWHARRRYGVRRVRGVRRRCGTCAAPRAAGVRRGAAAGSQAHEVDPAAGGGPGLGLGLGLGLGSGSE